MFFPVEQRDKDAASLRRYIAKRIDKKRFHERKNSAPDALTSRVRSSKGKGKGEKQRCPPRSLSPQIPAPSFDRTHGTSSNQIVNRKNGRPRRASTPFADAEARLRIRASVTPLPNFEDEEEKTAENQSVIFADETRNRTQASRRSSVGPTEPEYPQTNPEPRTNTGEDVNEFYQFLSSCQPPLDHMYEFLVAQGATMDHLCTTADWPTETKISILKFICDPTLRAGAEELLVPSQFDFAVLVYYWNQLRAEYA